jgi:hypothetical protein
MYPKNNINNDNKQYKIQSQEILQNIKYAVLSRDVDGLTWTANMTQIFGP